MKLIFASTTLLVVTGVVSIFSSSNSSVQAHSICNLREQLTPFKQCQHTHFVGGGVVISSLSGYYKRNDRPEVNFLNDNTKTVCHVQNPSQMEVYGGFNQVKVVGDDGYRSGTQFTGSCAWPDGFYKRANEAPIYHLSNDWKSACWVRSFERLAQLGGSGRVRTVDASSNLFIGRSFSNRC